MNLVTGGGGYIGSHLVQKLLRNKEDVRVLELPNAKLEHLPLDEIDLVYADIRDRSAVDKATQDCDYVYHLAADPNLWRKDTHEFDEINHQGALNVLHSALENGALRIMHTSTESILTSSHFDGGAVEHLELRESEMIGPYCLSKFHADQAALKLGKSGEPVILVCPTLPVGPGDRGLTPPTRMALAFCRGQLPAYLNCRFNLIDVRDIAEGMVAAMDKGSPGVRYLLGFENYLLGDWLELLGNEIDKTKPRYTVPYEVALSVAWFSENWARYVSGEMPMATITGVKLTQRSMHFDPSSSLKTLGLNPRPAQESASDTVEWFKSEGMLN
jgi:nucleoside-diphosphate-sugar epimerase